jgi:geranylgeranyl diphosphate synthase type I
MIEDPAEWRANFEGCFHAEVDALERRLIDCGMSREAPILAAFLKRPGKRLRPLFFIGAWRALQQVPTSSDARKIPAWVLRVASAIELFQAFVLIHDDIIDGAGTRRKGPALHVALGEEAEHLELGRSLALVAGDIVFGLAQESVLAAEADSAAVLQAARYFARISQETGTGEFVETADRMRPLGAVSPTRIEQVYWRKTSRYSFEMPLVLAAILNDRFERDRQILEDFARPLGFAFQLENDLHEVRQLLRADEPAGIDLEAGVKTAFLRLLHDDLDAREKACLEAWLRDGFPRDEPGKIRAIVCRPKAIERAEESIGDHFNQARQLAEAATDPRLGNLMLALADFLFKNRAHTEAGSA